VSSWTLTCVLNLDPSYSRTQLWRMVAFHQLPNASVSVSSTDNRRVDLCVSAYIAALEDTKSYNLYEHSCHDVGNF
jgi:hypothetical protein